MNVNGIEWEILHPQASRETLGFLPIFLSTSSKLPAAEQFNFHYSHGGGWRAMPGWERVGHDSVKYPGDKTLFPIAKCQLRNEIICVYPHAWVAIFSPEGTFEICRMD